MDDSLKIDLTQGAAKPRWRLFALLGGGALVLFGVVFFVMSQLSVEEALPGPVTAAKETIVEAPSVPGEETQARYVALPQPVLFKLPGKGREDYLVMVKAEFTVRSSDGYMAVVKHLPLLYDTLLTLFSSLDPNDLMTEEGKTALRTQSLSAVQGVLKQVTGQPLVEQVLFTQFVMQ